VPYRAIYTLTANVNEKTYSSFKTIIRRSFVRLQAERCVAKCHGTSLPAANLVHLGSRCRTRRNASKRRGLIAMEGRAGSSSPRVRPEKISLSENPRFSGIGGSCRSSCWP